MVDQSRILIIAGPNGSGKSTFAREYLPNEAHCPVFINADLIAAGLSPFDPDQAALRAGRLMLAEIDRHVAAKASFAFESTLSGVAYARRIPKWQSIGYHVGLVYLWLASIEVAISRVASRVRQGGHHIPEDTIQRRFEKGWYNFKYRYKPLVDSWTVYDNTGEFPRVIDRGRKL